MTLVLRTKEISDASIPLLARLTSTDLMIVGDSGISDSGIVELETLLPNTRVSALDYNASKRGETSDVPWPRSDAF